MQTALETFDINYKPTVGDFLAAYDLQMKRSMISRSVRIFNRLLAAFLILMAVLPPLAHTGPFAVFPAVMALVLIMITPVYLRARYSRDPRLGQEFKTTFSPEGFTVKSTTSKSEYLWTGVTDVKDNKKVVLIGFGPCVFDIIPKRAISDMQLQRVRDLAAASQSH